jgi:uncharacterized delta-60 repeat protein
VFPAARRLLIALLALVLVAVPIAVALAADDDQGSFDPTFGGDGRGTFVATQDSLTTWLKAVDGGAGRTLVAGDAGFTTPNRAAPKPSGLVVRRYLADGSLDPSWTAPAVLAGPGYTRDIRRLADGTVVIAHKTLGGEWQVIRLLADGAPDTGFGAGGVRTLTTTCTDLDRGPAVIGPDGAVTVAGQCSAPTTNQVLERFTPAGEPDTAFGFVELVVGCQEFFPFGLALDAPGRVVTVGVPISSSRACRARAFPRVLSALRYDAQGRRDVSYGGLGLLGAVPSLRPSFEPVFDAQGRLLIGLYSSAIGTGPLETQSFTQETGVFSLDVARLDADGRPDASWGDGGLAALTDAGSGVARSGGVAAVVPLPDGRVAITADGLSNPDVADGSGLVLGRFLPDGKPDTTLGVGGVRDLYDARPQRSALTGQPVLAADGRLTVPLATWTNVFALPTRAAIPATGGQLGVVRLQKVGPTATPGPPTATPPATTPPPVTVTPGPCRSRRAFTVTIRSTSKAKIRRVSVTVDGRAVPVRRRGAYVAQVDLRGKAFGTYVVRIRTTLSNGRTVSQTRRFRTCRVGASDRPAPTVPRTG